MPTPDGRYSGSEVVLSVDDTVLALQKGLTRSQSRDTISLTAKGDDGTVIIVGRKGISTCNLGGLWSPGQAAYQTLLDKFRSGDLVEITILEDGNPWEEASGFVTQMDEDWSEESEATFSAVFSVSGDWSDAVESS